MDVETISKSGTGYSSPEPAKTFKPEAVKVETEHAVPTAAQSRMTGSQKENARELEGKKEHAPSDATIADAVKNANRHMEHTRCEYSYHKETNRISIKVIDDKTDEVIREIPPEKSLEMLQKMWEMAGILVDEKR